MSGDVGAEVAMVLNALADEWDEHSDRLRAEARTADRDAAIVLRSKSGTYAVNAERLDALAPLIAEGVSIAYERGHIEGYEKGLLAPESTWMRRVEAAKAEALAPIRALADELQRDIEDRREDTPADDGSWPITRAEWVGHVAGLGDALTQLRAALDPEEG